MVEILGIKICTKCKQEKVLSEFTKDRKALDKLSYECKECVNIRTHTYRQNKPWITSYKNAKQRCENLNNKKYERYGGRGIKCLITEEELKQLWFRDKAYEMKKPSIDREDNGGNYTYDNCRFIEHRENSAKDKRKAVLQYDLEGNFIREFKSGQDAIRKLKIYHIYDVLNNKRKSAGDFIWKYKK